MSEKDGGAGEGSGGVEELRLLGGRACLDFANTVDPRREPRPGEHRREYLAGYPDLARWAERAGVVAEDEAERLIGEAKRRPSEAEQVFGWGVALREAVHRAFSAVALGNRPTASDLEALKGAYLGAMARASIAPAASGGFGWAWAEDGGSVSLERPLWLVARSAVELLTSGEDLARVKRCPADEGCGWLFYDGSKNASRRWCSMEGCGSRAKMRRMNARKKKRGHPV